MDKAQTLKMICEIVFDKQGCKAPELIAEVVTRGRMDGNILDSDFIPLLDELVADGSLVEVEYVLPNMHYRAKSFYLPGKTDVRLLGIPEREQLAADTTERG